MTTTKASGTESRAVTSAWLALSAITMLSWWLAPGHSGGHAEASIPITVVAILLGMVKCRMIIRYFMEVRAAPRWLRRGTDAWLVALWVAVLAVYLW